MSWKLLANEPLVTVGAHSITHCNLARQTEAIAIQEMAVSRERIEAALQRPVVHLAYPYGDKVARPAPANSRWRAATGFKTAVTTRGSGMALPSRAPNI